MTGSMITKNSNNTSTACESEEQSWFIKKSNTMKKRADAKNHLLLDLFGGQYPATAKDVVEVVEKLVKAKKQTKVMYIT